MLQITRKVQEGMLEHARVVAPEECCGLLVGRESVMNERVPCTNERHSATSFSIPPVELLAAFRRIREQGKRLLGIYHSHPSGPEHPSSRDVDEFEYPGVSYWVVSLHRPAPVVRCYHWTGKRFEEASFDVLPTAGRSGAQSRTNTRGALT
jgi:proteasome lid subunit RPN8/RPN11